MRQARFADTDANVPERSFGIFVGIADQLYGQEKRRRVAKSVSFKFAVYLGGKQIQILLSVESERKKPDFVSEREVRRLEMQLFVRLLPGAFLCVFGVYAVVR